jgi:endogenous inhibitor of DNA gyrase (YacG/DUF329 family)
MTVYTACPMCDAEVPLEDGQRLRRCPECGAGVVRSELTPTYFGKGSTPRRGEFWPRDPERARRARRLLRAE